MSAFSVWNTKSLYSPSPSRRFLVAGYSTLLVGLFGPVLTVSELKGHGN
jgi:hypothetical protein